MIPAALIARKRDHGTLSDAELEFFVRGFSRGEIPDYQMSAMAMAIFLNGMDQRETASLTQEMLKSGTRLLWPQDEIPRVDKHSTGGIGDKVSIILAPLLAECGVQVPMISGRGLGATGGTLDKLESIPGFRTDLSISEITELTQKTGCVITGASNELAPADQRLYALRDVTATVPSVPLITASIMSKKLAESLDALVLDVKFGSGAFMKTQEQARVLARSLVQTGQRTGLTTMALLTDMSQPLGRMCGNAIEIMESVDVLQDHGPADVRELTIALCTRLLVAVGICADTEAARRMLEEKLSDGSAYERYCRMVRAQGGDPLARLSVAPATDVVATEAGFVEAIDTEKLGMSIIAMGGGRRKMGDPVDHAVGIEVLVRIADRVDVGQPLARIFSNAPRTVEDQIRLSFRIGNSGTSPRLIAEELQADMAT